MATLDGPLTPRNIRAMHGAVDVYYDRSHQQWTARKWPSAHRPSPTQAWKATHALLDRAHSWTHLLSRRDRSDLDDMAQGGDLSGVDAYRKSVMTAVRGDLPWFAPGNQACKRDPDNTVVWTAQYRVPDEPHAAIFNRTLQMRIGRNCNHCPSVIWIRQSIPCAKSQQPRATVPMIADYGLSVIATVDTKTQTISASFGWPCDCQEICYVMYAPATSAGGRLASTMQHVVIPPCHPIATPCVGPCGATVRYLQVVIYDSSPSMSAYRGQYVYDAYLDPSGLCTWSTTSGPVPGQIWCRDSQWEFSWDIPPIGWTATTPHLGENIDRAYFEAHSLIPSDDRTLAGYIDAYFP